MASETTMVGKLPKSLQSSSLSVILMAAAMLVLPFSYASDYYDDNGSDSGGGEMSGESRNKSLQRFLA